MAISVNSRIKGDDGPARFSAASGWLMRIGDMVEYLDEAVNHRHSRRILRIASGRVGIDFLFGEPVERCAEFIGQPDPHHNLYSTSESRNWLRC